MYDFECLTVEEVETAENEVCAPFYGECYPVGEGHCGPECSPN